VGLCSTYSTLTPSGLFSKIKALLKKAAARTREALIEAMSAALASVTPEDARGWCAHSGYVPQDQRL
jgi:hypothetical protein